MGKMRLDHGIIFYGGTGSVPGPDGLFEKKLGCATFLHGFARRKAQEKN